MSLEGHGHLLSPLLGLTHAVVTTTSVRECADCHFTQEDLEARKLLEPAPALVAARVRSQDHRAELAQSHARFLGGIFKVSILLKYV